MYCSPGSYKTKKEMITWSIYWKSSISAVILKYTYILKYISVAKGIKGNFWHSNRYKVKSVKAKVALKMSSTLE
jgi:hypothetical protein